MSNAILKSHSVAAAVAGVALLAIAWQDVAVVHFVAALPLAASLAALALRQIRWSGHVAAILSLEIAVLLVVPRLYVHVRSQYDAARVVALAEQSRFGEAKLVADRVLAISPNASWKGNSLKLAGANLNKVVGDIEQRVTVALADSASDVDRLWRARDLAMLGRTEEALATIDGSRSVDDSPDASNLRGTIYETRGQWRAARAWYDRARTGWHQRDESEQRTAGLIRAITGVAFCERKLGRLREAEIAWHERLELSPTAESRFLLAQFYEDTQQAQKARLHAQQAIKLEPERYALQGRRLLDKLVTSHFGCLGVFSAKRSPSTPFGAATIESK